MPYTKLLSPSLSAFCNCCTLRVGLLTSSLIGAGVGFFAVVFGRYSNLGAKVENDTGGGVGEA